MTASRGTVRLGHLYPAEMNIYADRGNIAVLSHRLAWRGYALEVTELGAGEPVVPGQHDLYYLGGGQDRDQVFVASDMAATKGDGLRAAVADGAAMLCVCGGFQLAGHGYTGVDGGRMPGLGLLDLDTVAAGTRLIGDLVIDARIEGDAARVVGFENHAGRTRLGPDAAPLGRVVEGHGNNGDDGHEGAVQRRVVGTYLHGPLLPKNPWLADRLLSWALEHRTGAATALEPLDDALEDRARAVAAQRAARHRRR